MANQKIQNIELVRFVKEFTEYSEYENIFTKSESTEKATRVSNERVINLVSEVFGKLEFKNDGPILSQKGFGQTYFSNDSP
jgi:hypothetical protein